MKTITIEIPESVTVTKNDIIMTAAAKMYEQGTLSLGQAASLANLSKTTFAELLFQYNVSIFNYPAHELNKDLQNVTQYT